MKALRILCGALIALLGSSGQAQTVPLSNRDVTDASAIANCFQAPAGFSSPAVAAQQAPQNLWRRWQYGQHVSLEATPATALMDAPVSIRVRGLPPGAPVTLRASMTGFRKHVWVAQATFFADRNGLVDVGRTAPRYGSYAGAHAMGLIWSMQPQDVKNPRATMWAAPSDRQYSVKLEALAGGRMLATANLTREYLEAGVTETDVASDGLVGKLYRPATPGPHPAIIVLGGSEGGLYPQVNEAALFAAHGYIALGLAYYQGFGASDPVLSKLPKMLMNIPLEYFLKAADWLKRQPGVDVRHVAIMGWSKGAEAALVTAAEFPEEFQAVIGFMPSSVVWAGINYGAGPVGSSWTLRGRSLPWVNPVITPAMFAPGKPVAFMPGYRNGLNDATAAAKAMIPAERIDAPLLLISATDDQIWPSSLMAAQLMQRLAEHHHAHHDQSLCYAGAGHAILPPWRPVNADAAGGGTTVFAFGGDPVPYAFADQDAWQHVLKFLDSSLRSGASQ